MPEVRRKYDADFRAGAVRIVKESGKLIARMARDLEVNEGTLPWRARSLPGVGDCPRLGTSSGGTGCRPCLKPAR